ncbi:MAG: DUF6384 family protein [Planctomycetota bacterium]
MPDDVTRDPTTVPEMLRILDVASALRRERERAQRELAIDETKARLRERLRAAAVESGDPVTEAEIEAAITQYFGSQFEFRPPQPSFRLFLANAWIRRKQILVVGVLLLAVGGLGYWLFSSGPLSTAAERQAVAQREAATRKTLAVEIAKARGLATSTDAIAAIDDLERRTSALTDNAPRAVVTALTDEARAMNAKLDEEYAVRIVNRPGQRSGIDAYFEDSQGKRVSGYYLIVEAVRADGTVLAREVRDAETGRMRTVRTWGEQVPKAVYDRVARDKQEDGIVDGKDFAAKKRGHLSETIVLPDVDGRTPLTRGRQITENL